MKGTIRFYIFRILLSLAIVVLLCILFKNNYEELIGTVTGFLIATAGSDLLMAFLIWREDKNKVSEGEHFVYDRETYYREVKIGSGTTAIWYEPVEWEGDPPYLITDDPERYFTLDPILQMNFSAVMQAHRASFIANPIMIRLDDCKRDADGSVHLFTSRTAFYNDLVTNRSMDYRFNGEMSVREIFESGNFLTPLSESKMSNHIGYGALLFYGEYMILAARGGNATISKNKFTEGVAIGLTENTVIAAHAPLEAEHFMERHPVFTADDLLRGVLLVQLSSVLNLPLQKIRALYAENKIVIHTLGFGRLVYTGGKPQFYFAIVIDESVDLSDINARPKGAKSSKKIDYNKEMVFVKGVELLKNGKYSLVLTCRNGKERVGVMQKSFFANWWHLRARSPIEGVPEWVYTS